MLAVFMLDGMKFAACLLTYFTSDTTALNWNYSLQVLGSLNKNNV